MRHPDQSLLGRFRRRLAYNRHNKRIARRRQVESDFLRGLDLVVQAGPFKGMRYIDAAHCSTLAPKLLGAYELELHATVESVVARGYRNIVDIGAAEGYYAVGLAIRMPQSSIVAYESVAESRSALAKLARLNGVESRVRIEGEATIDALASENLADALVIMDVEGYESALLDPAQLPGLHRATIIVEIHEMFVPGLTEALRRRFAPTHELQFLTPAARNTASYPALAPVPEQDAALLLDEMRDPTGAGWSFGVFTPGS